MDERSKVTIFRYDPGIGKERCYQTFEVPARGWKDLKVLDTLRYIQKYLDGTLSFRESCRQYQICSACTMMVNKKVCLACEVMSTREMLIEPVPNYPLIKDLVVSFNRPGKEESPLP